MSCDAARCPKGLRRAVPAVVAVALGGQGASGDRQKIKAGLRLQKAPDEIQLFVA